jgi:hypothetical protein
MSDDRAYAWRLKPGNKKLEIFVSKPASRKIIGTIVLELVKPVTEEWAVKYMEQHHPYERQVDKKADAEDKDK